MDSVSAAKRMRGTVGMLAMYWLGSPAAAEKAAAAGMPEIPGYFAVGRLGVLGDCPVDNVVAAAFFWNPEYLRPHVESARAVMSPSDGVAIARTIVQECGVELLEGFEGVERLGELAERIVHAASPLGAPTFVGWRDQPLPEPGPGRTFQLMQTMRELGFGRHCTAVHASELSPLESIMSGPTGAWNAKLFGWPEPYPDGEPLRDLRKEVEAASNRLHAPDFDVLTDDERDEFVELAAGARAYAEARINPDA